MSPTLVQLFLAVVSLNLCCAQDILCSVTRNPGGILYSVPEFQATQCVYSWINSTGHVLTNEKEMMADLVLNKSVRTLLTSTCLNQVNYIRDCVSEKIQRTASCFTNCSGTAEPLKNKGAPHPHWSIVISVSIMVLIRLQFLPAAS